MGPDLTIRVWAGLRKAPPPPRRRPGQASLHWLLTGLLLVLAAGTGCASGPTGSAPTTPRPADPAVTGPAGPPSGFTGPRISTIDVLFLSMMTAHTEQTLQLVDLGLERTTDDQIRMLIAAIKATETDELTAMRRWLREAGPSAEAAAAGHDHSGHSDAASGITRLRTASADEVDQVLLDVLSAHQRTAADLAHAQVSAGSDQRVREFAQRVERSRSAQIELMATLGPATPATPAA